MYGMSGMYWVLPVLSTWQDNHNRWRWRGLASPADMSVTATLRSACARRPNSSSWRKPWKWWVAAAMAPFGVFFFKGEGHFGGLIYLEDGGGPQFHLVYLGFLVYSICVYFGDLLTMDIYHLLDGMILQVHPPARESNYLPETKIGRAAKGTYRNLVFPPSIFRCELLSPKSLSNWEFLRFSAHQQEAPTDFCAKNSCFQQIQAQEVIQRWCFSIPQSTAHQLWYLVYPPTIYMEFDTSQLS